MRLRRDPSLGAGASCPRGVDVSEIRLAAELVWTFAMREGIRFTETSSLQLLSNTKAKMLELTDQLTFDSTAGAAAAEAVGAAAVRYMGRVGVGAFYRPGPPHYPVRGQHRRRPRPRGRAG